MGLLDWFRKKPAATPEADQIWLTQEAKEKVLLREIQQRRESHEHVVIVAHFPSARDEVCALLRQSEIDFEQIQHEWDPRDVAGFLELPETIPLVVLAELLPESVPDALDHDSGGSAPPVAVLVIERHPLEVQNERVDQFASSLPGQSEVQFFESLEDPLMQFFAGDAFGETVKSPEGRDEAHPSQMVTRRMDKVHQKIKSHSFGNAPADSAREWLEKNYTSE